MRGLLPGKGSRKSQRVSSRQSSSMAPKWGVGVGGRSPEERIAWGRCVWGGGSYLNPPQPMAGRPSPVCSVDP